MICVILDANFLFLPFQFRIDIFEELGVLLGGYKPIVLSTTLRELRRLSKSRSDKVRMQASSALEVARRCEVVEVEMFEGETFDDIVLRVAMEMGCAVATNDREMRRRLREEGIPVVYLRGRSRLEVDGYIP